MIESTHDEQAQHVRLALITDIAGELLRHSDPYDVLDALLARLSTHLDLEVYFHYRVDEPSGRLRLAAHGGIADEFAADLLWLEFGQAVCGTVALEQHPLVLEDVQGGNDPRTVLIRERGITAYVCHPLIAGERLLGTLSFGTMRRSGFHIDDLEILHTVSDLIAMAIERSRLTGELRQRADELAAAVASSEANAAQLEAILTSMNEGVIITDLQGNVQLMNTAALRMHGFESVGDCRRHYDNYLEIFEAHYLDNTLVPMGEWPVERIARGESFSNIEVGVRRLDNGRSWIGSYSGTPVRNKAGEIILAAITTRDVTAQKQWEHDLNAAMEAAEGANRAKDQFLAILSHELRTPLTPVLTLAQELVDDPSLPPHLYPYLDIIRRNVELEVLLIDDLLDLTRISKGKLKLNLAQVDLHDLLLRVVEICGSDIAAKRLGIHTSLEARRCMVYGDPTRLHQVFWNLVKNAVKFTNERGSIGLRTCDVGEGKVQVEITDTGVGIPAELLGQIFNAFEQGDATTARRSGGLGLGLAISRALVDLHGGIITAESDGPGSGSRFTVTLSAMQF